MERALADIFEMVEELNNHINSNSDLIVENSELGKKLSSAVRTLKDALPLVDSRIDELVNENISLRERLTILEQK